MSYLTPKVVAVLREEKGVFGSFEEFEILERIEPGTELIDKAQYVAVVEQLKARVAELQHAPCECGAPVGYVSGDKYTAEHERLRDCRNERDQLRKRVAELEAQQSDLAEAKLVTVVEQKEPYEDGTPNNGKLVRWVGLNEEDDLEVGTKIYAHPPIPQFEKTTLLKDRNVTYSTSTQQASAAQTRPKSVEVLGKTCIDGGTCHHACATRCFRRECCTHFSNYEGPWAYPKEGDAQQPPARQVPVAWLNALNAAVSAIYFDDGSDFKSALWDVINYLSPEVAEKCEEDPSTAWHMVQNMLEED